MAAKVIEKVFKKMISQPCWNVSHSRWTNFSLNLGKARLVIQSCKNDPIKDRRIRRLTMVQAEWFFCVRHASWTLTVVAFDGKRKEKATASSTIKQKNQVCKLLTGQRLSSVEINIKNGKTVLSFDLGAELIIRRWEASTDDLWSLAEPNGYFLEINGDGTYSHVPGSGLDNRPAVNNRPLEKTIVVN